MNFAVLFYRDVPNPESIPNGWPAETKFLGDSTELPDDGRNWVMMKEEDLNQVFQDSAAEKELWNIAHEEPKDHLKIYAVVKGGTVISLAKNEELILANENVSVGDTYVDGEFVSP